MTARQRDLAWAVVDAAMSERGAAEIRSIVALEPVLGDLERRTGIRRWERRDPELYWLAVFGDPAGGDPWSWRLGGHHVAVQATVVDGRIVRPAPSFLGANPATIPDGPRAGQRAIDGEERLARSLLAALTPAERAIAVVDPVAPPDILSGNGRRADVRDIATGIRHDGLGRAGPGRAGGPDPPLPRPGRTPGRPTPPGTASSPTASRTSPSRGPARTSPAGATTTRSAGRGSSSSTTTRRTARTTSTRSGATWPTTGARTPSPRTTAPAITPRDRPSGAGQPAYAAGATPIAIRTRST